MKKLVSIIFILAFVLISINSVFAVESPFLTKENLAGIEKEIKSNPKSWQKVVDMGFPADFLESTLHLTRFQGDLNANMHRSNLQIEYVPFIKVKHMLYIFADTQTRDGKGWMPKKLHFHNEIGITLRPGSNAPVVGYLFTYPRGSDQVYVGHYLYGNGEFLKASETDRVLISAQIEKSIRLAISGN